MYFTILYKIKLEKRLETTNTIPNNNPVTITCFKLASSKLLYFKTTTSRRLLTSTAEGASESWRKTKIICSNDRRQLCNRLGTRIEKTRPRVSRWPKRMVPRHAGGTVGGGYLVIHAVACRGGFLLWVSRHAAPSFFQKFHFWPPDFIARSNLHNLTLF